MKRIIAVIGLAVALCLWAQPATAGTLLDANVVAVEKADMGGTDDAVSILVDEGDGKYATYIFLNDGTAVYNASDGSSTKLSIEETAALLGLPAKDLKANPTGVLRALGKAADGDVELKSVFVGSAFQVAASSGSASFRRPAIAYGGDKYMVVCDRQQSPTDYDIVYNTVSTTGVAPATSAWVDSGTTDSRYPDIAYSSADDTFLIVWSSYVSPSSRWAIYGKLLNSNGSIAKNTFRIYLNASRDSIRPRVSYCDGYFFVVWYRYDIGSVLYGIYGRWITASTGAVGNFKTIRAESNTDWRLFPDLDSEPGNNRSVVVWHEYDSGNSNYEIWARATDKFGNPQGAGPFQVTTYVADHDQNPHIAWSGDTNIGYLVTWERRFSATDRNIEGAWVKRDVATDVLFETVTDFTVYDRGAPDRLNDAPVGIYNKDTGEAVVAWAYPWNNVTTDYDIRMTRVSTAGTTTPDQTIVRVSSLDEEEPELAIHPYTRQVLAIWQDYRNTPRWDIYGQFWTARTFELTSPSAVSSWRVGTQHTINWNQSGSGGSNNVLFTLYKAAYTGYWWGPTTNDGEYTITVPAGLPEGTDYRIRLMWDTNHNVGDYSDQFEIFWPTFNITVPTGASSWRVVTNQNVTWTTADSDASENLLFVWYKGGNYTGYYTGLTPNDGSYSIYVPAALPVGSDYQLRLMWGPNHNVGDYSDNFSVYQPTFTIASPSAGNSFRSATNQNVVWGSSGALPGEQVLFVWYKGGVYTGYYTGLTDNDGLYTIWVPGGLLNGTDYQIRLMWGPDHRIGDYSDNFTLTVPSLTITDPTVATTWNHSTNRNVTWTGGDPSDTVILTLYKGGAYTGYYWGAMPNSGSHSVWVSSAWTPGSDYQIRVMWTGNGNVDDYSDNFTVSP